MHGDGEVAVRRALAEAILAFGLDDPDAAVFELRELPEQQLAPEAREHGALHIDRVGAFNRNNRGSAAHDGDILYAFQGLHTFFGNCWSVRRDTGSG